MEGSQQEQHVSNSFQNVSSQRPQEVSIQSVVNSIREGVKNRYPADTSLSVFTGLKDLYNNSHLLFQERIALLNTANYELKKRDISPVYRTMAGGEEKMIDPSKTLERLDGVLKEEEEEKKQKREEVDKQATDTKLSEARTRLKSAYILGKINAATIGRLQYVSDEIQHLRAFLTRTPSLAGLTQLASDVTLSDILSNPDLAQGMRDGFQQIIDDAYALLGESMPVNGENKKDYTEAARQLTDIFTALQQDAAAKEQERSGDPAQRVPELFHVDIATLNQSRLESEIMRAGKYIREGNPTASELQKYAAAIAFFKQREEAAISPPLSPLPGLTEKPVTSQAQVQTVGEKPATGNSPEASTAPESERAKLIQRIVDNGGPNAIINTVLTRIGEQSVGGDKMTDRDKIRKVDRETRRYMDAAMPLKPRQYGRSQIHENSNYGMDQWGNNGIYDVLLVNPSEGGYIVTYHFSLRHNRIKESAPYRKREDIYAPPQEMRTSGNLLEVTMILSEEDARDLVTRAQNDPVILRIVADKIAKEYFAQTLTEPSSGWDDETKPKQKRPPWTRVDEQSRQDGAPNRLYIDSSLDGPHVDRTIDEIVAQSISFQTEGDIDHPNTYRSILVKH